MKPKVAILRSDGANCDEELHFAFKLQGANPEYVQINELRQKSKSLKNFQVLALPGGFSYGDDIASGKILAIELVSFLKDEVQNFVNRNTLTIGICNGFQTLVRTGLLPKREIGEMSSTLANNGSGHFECRWTKIKLEDSNCAFLSSKDLILDIAVNHGEGRFQADKKVIENLEKNNQVVARYVDNGGKITNEYPYNPNNSTNSIAAICDTSGKIFGMMPHPEKYVVPTQHPNWRRHKKEKIEPHGSIFFKSIVNYFK